MPWSLLAHSIQYLQNLEVDHLHSAFEILLGVHQRNPCIWSLLGLQEPFQGVSSSRSWFYREGLSLGPRPKSVIWTSNTYLRIVVFQGDWTADYLLLRDNQRRSHCLLFWDLHIRKSSIWLRRTWDGLRDNRRHSRRTAVERIGLLIVIFQGFRALLALTVQWTPHLLINIMIWNPLKHWRVDRDMSGGKRNWYKEWLLGQPESWTWSIVIYLLVCLLEWRSAIYLKRCALNWTLL